MDFEDLTAAVGEIQRSRPRGAKFVHQPVTMIWAALRAVRGESRVARWGEVRTRINDIVAALGVGVSGDAAASQVLRLGQSSLLEFSHPGAVHSARNGAAIWLDQHDPLLGLTDDAYHLLSVQENFDKFAKLAVKSLPDASARIILDYFNIYSGFGEVPGVPEGTLFESRPALTDRRVHRNRQAGIVGNRDCGAESIVISGGYEDDEDYGDLIIYTGHGGREKGSNKQIRDQDVNAYGNAALVTSYVSGSPVRVIRGVKESDERAPEFRFRYDGLFQVTRCWQGAGKSGFRMCFYRLEKIVESVGIIDSAIGLASLPAGNVEPIRRTVVSDHISRARALSSAVKELHDYACQICDSRLTIKGRGYAEGAHIRPVGRPHVGTDTPDNLLCLCPNCHVLFDAGEITLSDDLVIASSYPNRGILRITGGHSIKIDNLQYHRALFVD